MKLMPYDAVCHNICPNLCEIPFFHACDKHYEKYQNSTILCKQTKRFVFAFKCPSAIFASFLCSTIFGEMVISQRHVVLRFEQKLQLQHKMFTQSRFAN